MNKLVADAIKRRIQRIAFDANLYDKGMIDYPNYKQCSDERKKLKRELEKLKIEQPELIK